MKLKKEDTQLVIEMGVLSNLLQFSDLEEKQGNYQKKSYAILTEVIKLNQDLANMYLNIYTKEGDKMTLDEYCGSFDFETDYTAKDFLNNLLYLCENASKEMKRVLNIKDMRVVLKNCGAHVSSIFPEKANKVIEEFRSLNTFEYE